MIPTRKSLSNGFSPGGPSFAKDGGAFVPGIPQEPLATLPQTELQKSASVESGGSTNRYESYWRVDQRDASKALDGQKHDGKDGLPVNTPEAPKEVPPETPKEVPPETPTAETPRTNQGGNTGGLPDEVEATERDTPDATRGDGNGEDSDDSIPLGYSPSSRPETRKSATKFDKYYHKCLGLKHVVVNDGLYSCDNMSPYSILYWCLVEVTPIL